MIIINVPRHLHLSANGREGWRARARKTRALRQSAHWMAKASKISPLQRAHLTVFVTWPPLKRRRDAANLGPTVKACLDGIVDAGLIPDDNDAHVVGPDYRVTDEQCDPQLACVLGFDLQPLPEQEAL